MQGFVITENQETLKLNSTEHALLIFNPISHSKYNKYFVSKLQFLIILPQNINTLLRNYLYSFNGLPKFYVLSFGFKFRNNYI